MAFLLPSGMVSGLHSLEFLRHHVFYDRGHHSSTGAKPILCQQCQPTILAMTSPSVAVHKAKVYFRPGEWYLSPSRTWTTSAICYQGAEAHSLLSARGVWLGLEGVS